MDEFIDISEIEAGELEAVLETARDIKNNPEKYSKSLENRSFLTVFELPSTRTRISFETGIAEMGGNTVDLSLETSQLSRGESLEDTIKTVSRYVDGIVARTETHEKLELISDNSSEPVINGLTPLLHPCQALSDAFTLKERNIQKLAFVGDGNNMTNSLINACEKLEVELRVSTPPESQPEIDTREKSSVKYVEDPSEAVEGAGAVYTDVWQSMGMENSADLSDYQVDEELMGKAGDAVFMHCLPAHRGEEVAEEVIDGDRSIVFDQAENRKHVQKAILHHLYRD